jgi:hypothetical protein
MASDATGRWTRRSLLGTASLLFAPSVLDPRAGLWASGKSQALPAAGELSKIQKKRVFSCPTSRLEDFRRFANQAAQLGATHVVISDLPKSRWQWDLDRSDPYPNWGMLMPTLFKVIVPPELKPFLPADYAAKNLTIIQSRVAVLKELGLKAAFSGKEPAWLPEAVYRAHPDWRGPRCEHPRRARKPYYAPCIDQPEVLRLYRQAVAELCRHAPIESFSLLTNDSGGGICWSVSLYPGQNGPSWCQNRSYASRVVGFLSAIQAGAREAGLETDVALYYGSGVISQTEVNSVLPSLEPGQSINQQSREGRQPYRTIGYTFYDNGVGPVLGIPQVGRIAEQLDLAQRDAGAHASVSLALPEWPCYQPLIRTYRQRPPTGILGQMQAIRALAAELAGEPRADAFTEILVRIDRAVQIVRSIGPDPILLVGTVNQRWLTRPLVPFPMELTADERDYYRRFQFQANSEAEAADLMNLQGFEMINGYSGSLLAAGWLEQALVLLRSAVEDLGKLPPVSGNGEKPEFLAALAPRVRALIACCRNAKHVIQYQDILDRTDYERPPTEQNFYPMDGDQLLREIQVITRQEIDNTNELIALLETARVPLFETAPTAEEEDIFLFGPNLVEQLRKKADTMLRHQLDGHRLYRRRQG